MKTFICEICGEVHIGGDKPSHCPFCGAPAQFIKDGALAKPIVEKKIEISELSKKNLLAALDLEKNAVAFYNCISGKSDSYEIRQMYKRLSHIEHEHASLISKVLEINGVDITTKDCSNQMVDNFKDTLALEEEASFLYARFAKEAVETDVRVLFAALTLVERDHVTLINNYYQK
jgi:rubrerythrin